MAVEYPNIIEKQDQKVRRMPRTDEAVKIWPTIAPETMARQWEKRMPQVIWLEGENQISTLLPTGEIFAQYGSKGFNNAPLSEDLDSSMASPEDMIKEQGIGAKSVA